MMRMSRFTDDNLSHNTAYTYKQTSYGRGKSVVEAILTPGYQMCRTKMFFCFWSWDTSVRRVSEGMVA